METPQDAPRKRGRPPTPRPTLSLDSLPSQGVTQALGDISEVWKNGRPYKYSNLGEIESLIDTYFLECDATSKRPNVSGLALALHMGYKQLIAWENLQVNEDDAEGLKVFKKGLRDMITRAKTRCAAAWWGNLEDRDKARGAEFALKVMGYQDRPDYQGAQGGNVSITQNNLVIGGSAEVAGLLAGILPSGLAKPDPGT